MVDTAGSMRGGWRHCAGRDACFQVKWPQPRGPGDTAIAGRRLHLLDSRCVENLKLRFPGHDPAELPLGTGMHAISFDPEHGNAVLHSNASVAMA